MDLKWSSKVPRKKFSIIYGLGAVHGTRFDSKNAVLWSDFRLLWTPNFQKLKNAISLENGKWPSWISHMFWLTYGAQCSAKKNSEKIRGRVVFWPGRKIGRNHGPARLRLKIGEFQKKNYCKSLPLYGLLMTKRWIFSQTYHIRARANLVNGPKTVYFSPKTEIAHHSPV